jgi:hypothetical protein
MRQNIPRPSEAIPIVTPTIGKLMPRKPHPGVKQIGTYVEAIQIKIKAPKIVVDRNPASQSLFIAFTNEQQRFKLKSQIHMLSLFLPQK